MQDKKYYITHEQYQLIEYFRDMFLFAAEELKEICESEKPDIRYGFEIGKLYVDLKKWQDDISKMAEEISEQG